MNERFYEDWALSATIDPNGTGSTTTATSDVIDMRDVEEVVFILSAGTLAAGCTVDLTVNSGTASGTVTTSVTSATQLINTDDNKQVIVAVKADSLADGHRYVNCVATVATGVGAISVVGLTRRKYSPANEHDLASVDEIVSA